MSRRQESIGDLLVMAPWWVAASLAPIAYAGLKWFLPHLLHDSENQIFRAFGPGISGLAPFAFGFFCLIALVSFFVGRKKRRLLDTRTNLQSLQEVSWKEFEWMIGEAFRRRGYAVEDSLRAGADGGVDIVLRGKNGTTLVQCKQWKTSSIGVPVIRELFGVMTSENADAGIIVTSGHFTREAWEFASGKPIELIDGNGLLKLIKDVQRPSSHFKRSGPPEPAPTQVPTCPDCGSLMILRVAKRGTNAGSSFWGCKDYPDCKGTRKHP